MKAWSAVALLFSWATFAAADTPQCGINDKLVTISFGHAVTDDEASAFLQRHQLAPNAGYLWVGGSPMAVSITVTAPGAAITTLRTAAQASRIAEQASLKGKAASFIAQHSRGELVRDLALAEQGKEILRQASRNDAVVKRVQTNKPLIWAVSACAAPATLAGIAPEEGVEVSEATPERPEQLSSRYPTPSIDALSGAEVYAALVKLARP
jgi:hypothetical protein